MLWAAAILPALAVAALGAATEEPGGQDSVAWRFDVTPYLWAADMDGDITLRGVTAPVDVPFKDTLERLEVAFMGRFEAHRGRLGFFLDTTYMALSEKVRTRLIRVNADFKLAIIEAGASYRVLEIPIGSGNDRVVTVEVLGGGRYIYNKRSFDFARARDIEKSHDWIDPLIGARVLVPVTERIGIGVRGDASGFGVGSGSDLTWNLMGGLYYKMSERVTMKCGYRCLDVDFERSGGAFASDLRLSGPILGATISF
jgi:hypothetical protein